MTTVLVLGTHRSGTSLVTGMLQSMGVPMGPKGTDDAWIYPNWANPTGQYENPELTDLLHRFLDFDGEEPRWDPRWDDLRARTATYLPEFQAFIARTRSDLWGWKHPWSLLVLDALLPSLPDARFVVVRRKLDEVVDSLYRRDGLSKAEAEKVTHELWARLDALERDHPGIPRIDLTYEEVLKDPEGCARRLAEFLGIPATGDQLRRAAGLVIRGPVLRRAIRRYAAKDLLSLPIRYGWLLKKDLRERSRFTASHLYRSLPRETYRILRACV